MLDQNATLLHLLFLFFGLLAAFGVCMFVMMRRISAFEKTIIKSNMETKTEIIKAFRYELSKMRTEVKDAIADWRAET